MKTAIVLCLMMELAGCSSRKSELAREPMYPYPCNFGFADYHLLVVKSMSDDLSQACKDGLVGERCEDQPMWNNWTLRYEDCLVIRLPQNIDDQAREMERLK